MTGLMSYAIDSPTDSLNTVGAAVSGTFLFVVGVANSIILYRIIKQRRRVRIEGCLPSPATSTQGRMQETNQTPSPATGGEEAPNAGDGHLSRSHHHGNTLLMKIIGPVITFVDRPWKVSVVSA
jgi:high-affinity nickel-transport protein